ncbi:SusD/RagB family nutrient-binding outer membrane lipoprotein [Pedobacter nyackensis]|uniref:SusD/RagB family nutrient-binding outer membrane lipoprotein n=1 Tax=Pedobacter nyackensis TaxID=475255 RepID=UPI00292E9895|nr:SusD/RagB family nutrient-binding outer membrane lipoprotein [Pedobacter nyackensis]
MKNILYTIGLCMLVLASSCKTGDDLYDSPNSPVEVSPSLMLTAIEVNTFMNTEGDLARVSAVFSQQMAGVSAQYSTLQNYQLNRNDYNNHWNGLYSGTMYNAKLLIDKYGAENPRYGGIAKVLMAINLSVATDFFGDVPYSDAFKGAELNFVAKFDKQQAIYQSIQKLLDEAIVDLGTPAGSNNLLPGDDDVIFNGAQAKWISAAWTLKARFANRLSQKDASGSANQVLTYLANGIKTSADNMENIHDANYANQWGDFENNRGRHIVANKKFVDILNATNDPRLPYYFEDVAGAYLGTDINVQQLNTGTSIIGPYFATDQNYGLVTLHEAKFLEAEAKARLGQDASTALNDGIRASVAYVTKGANTGASLATFTSATATLTAVMTEKWKAMFGHIEAYNDVRRTGIPALTPRPQSVGAVLAVTPKRLPMPVTESDTNPNAIFVPLDQAVWWAGGN